VWGVLLAPTIHYYIILSYLKLLIYQGVPLAGNIKLFARRVRRLKGGLSTTHPLHGDELRVIRAWLKDRAQIADLETDTFFVSGQNQPMNRATVNQLLAKYGVAAKLPFDVHPHMLRHGCGFALADQGADTRLIQDYLGHRNIQHTVLYTASNPARFEKLWRT